MPPGRCLTGAPASPNAAARAPQSPASKGRRRVVRFPGSRHKLSGFRTTVILKDGASSIYGTDAIAGVVNFITRKDVTGFESTLMGHGTQQGGANQKEVKVTYGGFRNLTLTAGVRNLFNRAPPFTNQGDTMQVGYDPSYADPRGTTYYARLTYAFK